jgi:hypothetical protein
MKRAKHIEGKWKKPRGELESKLAQVKNSKSSNYFNS